jgi:hypothetical protein
MADIRLWRPRCTGQIRPENKATHRLMLHLRHPTRLRPLVRWFDRALQRRRRGRRQGHQLHMRLFSLGHLISFAFAGRWGVSQSACQGLLEEHGPALNLPLACRSPSASFDFASDLRARPRRHDRRGDTAPYGARMIPNKTTQFTHCLLTFYPLLVRPVVDFV